MEKGEFVIVIDSIDLTECHRMAIPRDPMCGLYVVRTVHGHEAIYNLVEEIDN